MPPGPLTAKHFSFHSVFFLWPPQSLGVVETVGAGLAAVEVRGRDPFGASVGEFAGDPALFCQAVVRFAGERQLVDVGAPARGPLGDVVDLGEVAGGIAAPGKKQPRSFDCMLR
jgi:hypothetical protein